MFALARDVSGPTAAVTSGGELVKVGQRKQILDRTRPDQMRNGILHFVFVSDGIRRPEGK